MCRRLRGIAGMRLDSAGTGAHGDATTHTRTRNAGTSGKPVVGSLLVDAPICRLGLGLGLGLGLASAAQP